MSTQTRESGICACEHASSGRASSALRHHSFTRTRHVWHVRASHERSAP